MSLYLPEQKLGSHSSGSGSSNKFILKGRQTGGMHRGHTWVFRAESHDTMMAWYEDIKALTEKSPAERSEYVRGHARSFSRSSQRSYSSDGVVDEDDDEPFAASTSLSQQTTRQENELPRRPEPGGRFPSDLQINAQRGLQVPVSPSSVSTASFEKPDPDAANTIKDAVALPGSAVTEPRAAGSHSNEHPWYGGTERTPMEEAPSHATVLAHQAREDGVNPYTNEPFYDRNPVTDVRRDEAVSAVGARGDQRLGSTAEGRGLMLVGEDELAYNQSTPAREIPETARRDSGNYGESSSAIVQQQQQQQQQQQREFVEYQDPAMIATAAGAIHAPFPPNAVQTNTVQKRDEDVIEGSSNGTTVFSSRPTSGTMRSDSVPTISNLHVPGEYPRSTPNV
jgi:hypothetical protein